MCLLIVEVITLSLASLLTTGQYILWTGDCHYVGLDSGIWTVNGTADVVHKVGTEVDHTNLHMNNHVHNAPQEKEKEHRSM